MSNKQILMLSSSRSGEEAYLQGTRQWLLPFLGDIKSVLFVPYAGVSLTWDAYVDKVREALPELTIDGLHQYADPILAIKKAKAILVGGGNTFQLLTQLQRQNLLKPIIGAVDAGTPYVGWSAGSNICGQTIKTTNDMPIVEPISFDALAFLPCQINPHYTDYQPPGHNGETRAERITEFCILNPNTPVIGIREGSALALNQNTLKLLGERDAVLFIGNEIRDIAAGADLTDLL